MKRSFGPTNVEPARDEGTQFNLIFARRIARGKAFRMLRLMPHVPARPGDLPRRFRFRCQRAGLLTLAFIAGSMVLSAEKASAQAPFGFGFQPFGFYQPYGIQYQSAVPTPPYFAVNPPVYYGTRYRRPYGISPFASPPVVQAPASFQASPDAAGMRSRAWPAPVANPFICTGESPLVSDRSSTVGDLAVEESQEAKGVEEAAAAPRVGEIRVNPFVDSEKLQLARR